MKREQEESKSNSEDKTKTIFQGAKKKPTSSKKKYYKVYKDRFNKSIRDYIIYFRGKKRTFSINKLLYCLVLNGRIIHMAESRPGARLDQGLLHEDTGSDKVYSKFIIPKFHETFKPNDYF
ncbi:hypothetical protein ACTFIV_003601 [Dictyostelium citrinum]